MADYKSWENTNQEKIRQRLAQEYDNAKKRLFEAEASLVDVEERMNPLSFIEWLINPYHFWVSYSSWDDLENIQKNLQKQIEDYTKDRDEKKKAVDDFEKVISWDIKYSELFPDVELDKEYIIMWPEWELGKNRWYWDEIPWNLYLWRIKDYKIQVQWPNWEWRDYNLSEWEKDNRSIFTKIVNDTADKYYEWWAKVNKWENPQGLKQKIFKSYNLNKGRKILNTPLKWETLYTDSWYNSLIQDIIGQKMNRF